MMMVIFKDLERYYNFSHLEYNIWRKFIEYNRIYFDDFY